MGTPGYQNGVWTLVPDTCNSPVDAGQATSDRARRFTLTGWRSFVDVRGRACKGLPRHHRMHGLLACWTRLPVRCPQPLLPLRLGLTFAAIRHAASTHPPLLGHSR